MDLSCKGLYNVLEMESAVGATLRKILWFYMLVCFFGGFFFLLRTRSIEPAENQLPTL